MNHAFFERIAYTFMLSILSYLLYRVHNNIVLYLWDLLLFFYFIDKFLLINRTRILTSPRTVSRIFRDARYSINYVMPRLDDLFSSLSLSPERTVS